MAMWSKRASDRGSGGSFPPLFYFRGKLKILKSEKREVKETDHGLTTPPFPSLHFFNARQNCPLPTTMSTSRHKISPIWRRGGVTRIMVNAASSLEFLIFGRNHSFFWWKNAHGPFFKRYNNQKEPMTPILPAAAVLSPPSMPP